MAVWSKPRLVSQHSKYEPYIGAVSFTLFISHNDWRNRQSQCWIIVTVLFYFNRRLFCIVRTLIILSLWLIIQITFHWLELLLTIATVVTIGTKINFSQNLYHNIIISTDERRHFSKYRKMYEQRGKAIFIHISHTDWRILYNVRLFRYNNICKAYYIR